MANNDTIVVFWSCLKDRKVGSSGTPNLNYILGVIGFYF